MKNNFVSPFVWNIFLLVNIFRNDDWPGMEWVKYVTASPRYPHSYNKSDKSSPIDDRYWDQKANVGRRHKPTDNQVVHRTGYIAIAVIRLSSDRRVYQSQVGDLRDDDKRDVMITCR